MKTKIQLFVVFLLLAVGALWLSSCSSEDAVQGSGSKADASLTLTINTGKVGSRATAWTTDPAGSDKTQTENENKINRLTVGIFSKDGSKVKTIVELKEGTGPNSFTTPAANESQKTETKANIVTTSLEAEDQVLVAVNAPEGTFASVSKVTDFESKTEDAKDALTDGSSEATEIATNIPMYGKDKLSGNGNAFTATVTVQHQLAKISLTDLEVAFDANGPYKDAKFTPTEFFLVNVPEKLAFNYDAWVNGAGHFHGFDGDTDNSLYKDLTNFTTICGKWKTAKYKGYLATGSLNATELAGTSAKYASAAYFYVTPSDDDTADGKMKLIIAGTFKTNSSDAGTTVFYPVALNAVTNADGSFSPAPNGGADKFKVYPNKNYVCKVVIKTKGTTDPTQNLDPQTAEITVSVKDFDTANQTTTFE